MNEWMDTGVGDAGVGGVEGNLRDEGGQLRDAADLIDVMGIPFSDEQIEAITADPAPGVIIAGAGTGKTTVMAARVVWLVGRGLVTPDRVLGLTFTRKAAGELAARTQAALAKLAPDDDRHCAVHTYDGFASRLVGEFGAWIGSDTNERVLSNVEPYILADKVLRHPDSEPGHLADKAWSTLTRAIVTLESRIQSHLITDEAIVADADRFIERLDRAPLWRGNPYRGVLDARQVAEERLDLLGLCQRYRAAKKRESVVEFADQMASAVRLATRLPGVGRALREQYGLVVVDEFQDTSAAQVALLSLLFGAQGGVDEYPITAVGDPLQAIYTWRGAAADNIYSFHRWFPSAGKRTYSLSINRRSGAHILDAANAVASQVRADPQLGVELAVELRPADQAQESTVVVREFLTADEEVEWLAEDLVEAHRRGEFDRWDQVAILVRRNRDVGPVLQACRARSVPIAVQEVGGLLSVEAVSQLYAMMRLIIDDQANPQVAEILTGPRFRIGLADMERLGHRARQLAREAAIASTVPAGMNRAGEERVAQISLVEMVGAPAGSPAQGSGSAPGEAACLVAALRDLGQAHFSDHARASFRRLVDDIDASRQFFGNVLDQVHRLIGRIGLGVEIYASQEEGAVEVRQFLAHVASFVAHRPDASLMALVSYLDAEAEYSTGLQRANPTEEDAVSIMTVHRAKGLEWEVVYLPNLVDKVFPDERLTDNPLTRPDALPTAVRSDHAGLPQIGEVSNAGLKVYGDDLKQALARSEDRLAYVALTRAKRRLVMTAHRWSRGTTRPRVRSRYIAAVMRLDAGQIDGQLLPDVQDDMPDAVVDRVVELWPQVDNPVWAGAAEAVRRAMAGRGTWDLTDLPEEVRDRIAAWDSRIDVLERDARTARQVEVVLPTPMSTSEVVRLEADEQSFAARLMRPVPSPPSRRADVGSRFHSWVEQFYSQSALIQTPDRVSDQMSVFTRLKRHFLDSRFAAARPSVVEHDFVAVITGQVITGRIDAVFRASDNPGLVPQGKKALVVDWKTGHTEADSAQLAVYAQAWATESGIPLADIAAGFFYVSTGEFVEADLG